MDCAHHPTCPGCPLLGLPYAEQLKRKRARLVAALQHFPHLPEPEEIVGSAWTAAYRHRLKLPIHAGRERVAIGLYAADGRRVLDTPDCPVLADGLRAALPVILDWLRGRRGVHSLDLRVSRATGQLQAIFACRGGDLHGGAFAARGLMRDLPVLASVAVSRADPEGSRVMGQKPRIIAGKATIEEAVGPTRYELLPGSFFQADPRQAGVLHALVRDAVGGARTVLDLYAGVGAYALMLAPGRDRVVAVEEVPQAAEAARRQAPPNVTVLASRVEDADLRGHFDVAVLNPARRGSDPDSLARVSRLAGRMVYVSCGPETLARDLDVLSAHGMRVKRLVPIDLFPQTAEVETVAVLERGPTLKVFEGRRSPWLGGPSGAVGRPTEIVALVVGSPPDRVPGARLTRLGTVASHTLLHLALDTDPEVALTALAKRGNRVAGEERKTARFFAEKAGLQRPFVHVLRAGAARAPLHGDLVLALQALGAPSELIAAASRAPERSVGRRGGKGR